MLRIEGPNLGATSGKYNCDKVDIICQGREYRIREREELIFLVYVDM